MFLCVLLTFKNVFMKPLFFTLVIALGLIFFFVGNFNNYKEDAIADGKDYSFKEWAIHTALLIVVSLIFFMPSLNITAENIASFETTAAGLTNNAISGIYAAIFGALIWGFGIPALVNRTIIPLLTKVGVTKSARQKNREKEARK